MKWLSELPDELEVFIALREFEEAVAYIEKGQYRIGLDQLAHNYLTQPKSSSYHSLLLC
jgi:hypothetical protein